MGGKPTWDGDEARLQGIFARASVEKPKFLRYSEHTEASLEKAKIMEARDF